MSGVMVGIRFASLLLGFLGLGAPSETPPAVQSPGAGKQVVARPAASAPGARKWAVVIGVGEYADRRIPAIPFCQKDATDLAAALRARSYEVVCLTRRGREGQGPGCLRRTGREDDASP